MIVEKIGEPAMLELLAEEAAELAQAALKLARIKRGENPTPVAEDEALQNLVEEYTDVCLCATELKVELNEALAYRKTRRFEARWAEMEKLKDKK